MRFIQSTFLAVAALAGLVMAGENPIIFPDNNSNIVAGTPFLITWTPTTGKTIDLALRQGPSGNLHDIETICTLNPNTGTYQWTPKKSLPAGTDYAIKITDDQGNINYTPLITIKSDTTAVSSSSSSSSASSTKSSSTAKASSSSSAATTEASSTITSSASASLSTSLTQAYANTTMITSSVGYSNATATGNLTRSSTRSSTPTSSSDSSTSTTASAISTGAASGLLKSPLALVVCVLGAVLYLN